MENLSGISAETMRLALKDYLRPLFKTQEEMAERLGTTQSRLSNMLNPKVLSPIPTSLAVRAALLLGYPDAAALLQDLEDIVDAHGKLIRQAKEKYPQFGDGVWAAVHDMMRLRPLKTESPEMCRVFAVLASNYYNLPEKKVQQEEKKSNQSGTRPALKAG